MGETIRLDLERLQALPLDLTARMTLWRELRALPGRATEPQPSSDAQASSTWAADDALDDTLRRLLLRDQLSRCRELAMQGQWCEAAERLASLRHEAEALDQLDSLTRLLLELLEPLHQRLVGPKAAPPCQQESAPAGLHRDDNAELLWHAAVWHQLINERGLAENGPLSVIAEQIARLGAITWLERFRQADAPAERLRALIRSQVLLIELAQRHHPCPLWVERSLRDGLKTGLIWLGRGLDPAELLRWSQALVESVIPEMQRAAARPLLWPGLAALEIGEALQIEPFTSISPPKPSPAHQPLI